MAAPHKIVLIGPANSGKTALQQRFQSARFTSPVSTNEVKSQIYHTAADDRFQIFDLPGAERHRNLSNNHLKDAEVILLACDLSDKQLEKNMTAYLNSIKNKLPAGIPFIQVGTKKDKATDGSYDKQIMNIRKKFKKHLTFSSYIETSAVNGRNIRNLFITTLPGTIPLNKPAQIQEEEGSNNNKKSNNRLINHLQTHSRRYAIGALLMIATIALFAVPSAMPAALLAWLTSTGLSLMAVSALFSTIAALSALLAFFAPVIIGWALKLLGNIVKYAPVVALIPLVIAALVIAAVIFSAAYLTYQTGRLLIGLGNFCLGKGEGFSLGEEIDFALLKQSAAQKIRDEVFEGASVPDDSLWSKLLAMLEEPSTTKSVEKDDLEVVRGIFSSPTTAHTGSKVDNDVEPEIAAQNMNNNANLLYE